ncbi:DUF502 domain-containing protein [Alphaproteobacteria bacterium]|nr:DUF502 domain-containing protein [Alphaproteobacteria bacterium]
MISTPTGNHPHTKPGLLSKLKGYFLSGILVSTPILLTIYLVVWVVRVIDDMVRPLVPDSLALEYGYFPGYGLIATLVGATVIGAFVKGFFGRYFISLGEKIVSHMPVIRGIYATIKQISQAVLDKKSSSFREVGLIEYPRTGVWTVCFITGRSTGEVQEKTSKEVLNVFVPTTPNPTSGFLLFVPKKDIKILNMSVESGIKVVVSAGVIAPKPSQKEESDKEEKELKVEKKKK